MPAAQLTVEDLIARVKSNALYDVTEGRGAPPPDGLVKSLNVYQPESVESHKTGHLSTISAGETGGINGALKSLEDSGQYGMWTSRKAAVKGVAAGYWDQVKADAAAGMPRSRLIFVENQMTSAQFVKESDKLAEERGIIEKDNAVVVRQFSGKSTLAPGHRVIATGAFNQANKDEGIAAGESGAIQAIGKHATDPQRNLGTYATVKIDGIDGTEGRITTFRVATPEDYFKRDVSAAKILHREDIPIASKEVKAERSGLHWVAGLDSEHIQHLSVARTMIIASKALTSNDFIELMGKTKDGAELHSTNALGSAEELAEKVAANDNVRVSETGIEGTPAQEDWAKARKKIQSTSMYEIKEGRGAAASEGVIKPLKPYQPVSKIAAKKAHLGTIVAMGEGAGIGGALKNLEEQEQYGIWASRKAAVKGVAAGYWDQVKADAAAGMPISRLNFVENQMTSAQFVKESDKLAEERGIIDKDSAVVVRQFSGKSTLAPGHRVIATGAFNQANKDEGIAAGESGAIQAIGKHPTNPQRNPGTYATVKIDGIDGNEGRITTFRVATPEDYFKSDVSAAKILHREDIPIASKEVKAERSGLHWVAGLDSEHIKKLNVGRTTIIASKMLTSNDLCSVMGKSKYGIEVHSTNALGDAAALTEKVQAADERTSGVELDIDATTEPRHEVQPRRTGLHRVSGPPSLTVVQGGRSGENRSPIRRLGSSGSLSKNASQQSLEDHDSAMDGLSAQEDLLASFDFEMELEQNRSRAQDTGQHGLEDRSETDRARASAGRV